MPEIVDVTGEGRDDGVQRATDALRSGQLAVIPTDTAYGIAADAFDPSSTLQVLAAKGRDRRTPLPVLVRSPKQLAGLTTTVPESAERLVAAYWPGPLTIVIPSEPNLQWDLGETEGTVAVRMPLDDVALAVIRAVGPLAVTTASRAGHGPAVTAQEALDQFGDRVAVYVDDGPRQPNRLSTIVDLTRGQPAILREGALDSARVIAVASGELDPADTASLDDPETPAGS